MPDRLTLLIPGLLGPWSLPAASLAGGPDVPALRRLLSRADPRAGRTGSLESLLFDVFGYREADADLPVGAVTAAVDLRDDAGNDPARDPHDGGWWMRADPVHLRADRDTLVLTGHGELGLTGEETRRLTDELDEVFAPFGARLYAGPAERWYLRLPGAPAVRTHPPSEVLGRDVRPYLPQGEQAPRWHALMNEAQMQLNMSPVTRARQQAGALTANSLWFWGGGRAPDIQPLWDTLWCDVPLGLGLARLAGVPCRSPSGEGTADPPAAGRTGAGMVILEEPARALRALDAAHWQAAVQAVHDRWLAPALSALGRGEMQALTLMTGGGTDYVLSRRAERRWWRRTRPLEHFLSRS